ncbi:uncharacterized protein LOC102618470 isoform X1 [Citrus sinensis]|uniref:uncharacterized protein LOC112100363 isoform X1 n=1 Tax=Citrus clementina TaxID=85681 RepID=UPI000CED159B|nr:uncharacterized protein LOC112100363 isoform X1 [Citrus x clementina]XP_052289618.1 uncharacterized protein LOC102618470 isoform X1 [Citrus sinensis]
MVLSPDAHLARLPRISACFSLVSLFRSHITSGMPLFLLRKFKLVFLFNNHLAFFINHSISNFISILSRRRTHKEFQLALASFASRISVISHFFINHSTYKEKPMKKFSLLQLHSFLEFQTLSGLQKERRALNLYNHHLGRKGYNGLKEEIV